MTRQLHYPILLLFILLGCQGCQQSLLQDSEGNRYRTVEIGEQLWMAENLRSTRYNDGTPIPYGSGYEEWASLEAPAYCWYNNDSTYRETYGALYNWYVVETEKLCPEGWHVPTDEEWSQLVYGIENPSRAGGDLKQEGTSFWREPNTGATDAFGFSGLPGGYRSYNGTFNLLRASGYWWSSTAANWFNASNEEPTHVIFRSVQHDNSELIRHISEKTNGFSVRCVKDQ